MINFLKSLFRKKQTPKRIEIDDSGSGALYGGVIILVTDGKNDFYREIPLKIFNIKDKKKRSASVQKNIYKIIRKGIRKLNAKKEATEIFICQGNVFDFAEKELKKQKYIIKRGQIKGRTNDLAEEIFHKLLKEKYNIKTYNHKDYKGENLRQYATLKNRRDFKNVKQSARGVKEIETFG